MNEVSREMPRYKCYKEVHALKIAAVELLDYGARITPEEGDLYAPFTVSQVFLRKHDPKAGGYYVVYADGYKSFSPAEAFEKGYTRIET